MKIRPTVPNFTIIAIITPITCLPDDCLLSNPPVDLPWKNGLPASALVTSEADFDTAPVPRTKEAA